MTDDRSPRLEADAFDPDELATWSAVATLLEWLPAALDAQLQRDAGLTHFELGVLFALDRADDATLRLSTLAEHANSSLSRLSRAVDRLARRGWVERVPDPDDRRATRARLTPAGAAAFADANPGHVALVRSLVLEPLTATQRRHLRDASLRVADAIRAGGGWRPDDPRTP